GSQHGLQTAMVPPATEPKPPGAPPLAGGALVQEIKRQLKRVGCYGGQIDDRWSTTATRTSIQNFVKYAKLPFGPAEPQLDLLDTIRDKHDRVCPPECTPRQVERNGECVAKVCPNGLILNEVGDCVSSRRSALPSSGVDERNARSKARPQETSRSTK